MTKLKLSLYLLLLALVLTACNQNSSSGNTMKLATSISSASDSIDKEEISERKTVADSLIFIDENLFTDLNLVFNEISKNEFQSYKRKYKTNCVLDSGQFISGSGLYVTRNCRDICETYLAERTTNRKMLMPSNYDAGILKMLLSPTCNQLIICSSYDGPEFEKYYEDRAEFFIFNVNIEFGLKGIKPAFKYFTKDWSIEDLTWVNEKTIALKIYEENRWGDGSSVHYKYLKTEL